MPHRNRQIALRRLLPLAALLLGLIWMGGQSRSSVAAPAGQTVPTPTAAPELPEPVATPTPRPTDEPIDDEPIEDDPSDEEPTEGAPAEGSSSGGSALLPPPDVDQESVVALVGATGADLYAGPGASYAWLGALDPETPVDLIGRDTGLAWYVACCLPDGQAGWTAAANVTGPPLSEITRLPIISDWRALADETEGPDVASAAQPETGSDSGGIELRVEALRSPLLAKPGQTVTLEFAVENLSDAPAENVSLRGDLATGLAYVSGEAEAGEFVTLGEDTFEATWSALRPRVTRTVIVAVRLDDALMPGSVLEQVVAADATEASVRAVRTLIGLPPDTIPQFR